MYYFNEIESTNSWLIGQAEVDGKFCIAGHQTAGRGRRGKSWVSHEGGAILLSMGFALQRPFVPGLSLVSGLAVIAALGDAGFNSARLKWPNDILFEGRKAGGILVEISGSSAVIGVGLNLDLQRHGMDYSDGEGKSFELPWTDLNSTGISYDSNEILLNLLKHHRTLVSRCIESGFSRFCRQWNAVHEFQDQDIDVISGDKNFSGIARGVDGQGGLLVESAQGMVTVQSGDVSVRRSAGNVTSRLVQ
jgi:BirA family biotin operon repressor/biotin-[acetyl-CoA-carboxylase] ligase